MHRYGKLRYCNSTFVGPDLFSFSFHWRGSLQFVFWTAASDGLYVSLPDTKPLLRYAKALVLSQWDGLRIIQWNKPDPVPSLTSTQNFFPRNLGTNKPMNELRYCLRLNQFVQDTLPWASPKPCAWFYVTWAIGRKVSGWTGQESTQSSP